MLLGGYYLLDPRVVLVPIEHLTPAGMTAELASFLHERDALHADGIALLNRALALYWERSSALAQRSRAWPAPRLRHVALVRDSGAVRPYAQMLNTSAWTLYAGDVDPLTSNPELAAYLLVHWDHMAVTGEVTMAAVHSAAYWFDRSDAECAAFAAAVERSQRPDAEALRAVARSTVWLRQLRHESLRPPPPASAARYRTIPNTGLMVPIALERDPPELVERWRATARDAVVRFHRQWKQPDAAAAGQLLAWLESERPPLLVAHDERILWSPEEPRQVGALRQRLRDASGAGVRDIAADLRLVAEHTRRFMSALATPEALPQPHSEPEQRGYAYLHRDRRLLAYNLNELWTERLLGPALPFAHAMLGARVFHEWCHLAVDAGWVPQVVDAAELAAIQADIGDQLDTAYREAPAPIRKLAAAERRSLGERPGYALAESLLPRFADYRANLLAQRFLSEAERETYVRQNIRTLRSEYRPAQIFGMLARYLYEYQYLGFSRIDDRRTFFLRSTWFDEDFLRPGILDEQRFDALATAVARLCSAYAVDESRFRPQDADS